MNQNPGQANQFDPFAAWRSLQDNQMEAWSKAMIDAVNSQAYAEATGKMLDAYLTISGPFQQALEKSMSQALGRLGMPSRADVTSLAERFTNIEMRLDDLDAKLDEVLAAVKESSAGASTPKNRAKDR